MRITERELENELEAFGVHRVQVVTELAHEGFSDGIGPALLLALARARPTSRTWRATRAMVWLGADR